MAHKRRKIETIRAPKSKTLSVPMQDMVDKIKLAGREPGDTGPSTSARYDGWSNALVGLGKAQDKSRATRFTDYPILVRDELSRMYVGDGMGRRIVDIVPDDMTREWLTVETGDNNLNALLTDALDALSAETQFNIALKWKRLFGGSILVIGVMDGQDLDQPVNVKTARSIDWLKPIDMWDVDLVSSVWERDPTRKMFGKVIKYMVQFRISGTGVIQRMLVHHTRVIDFHGETIPPSIVMGDQRARFWGASILQHAWDGLKNYGGVMASVSNILYEFIIGKYKLSNLSEMLVAGKEAKLIQRMEIINMAKSMLNAVLLGEGEEYTRDTASVAGLADLIDRFMTALAATVGIPVTRLFGISPAGLNATGESDMKNYYDTVRSQQKTSLKPAVLKLFQLMLQITGRSEVATITFNPLEQLNEKEEAELENKKSTTYKQNADADMVYAQMGAISVEAISKTRGFDELELLTAKEGKEPEQTPGGGDSKK